MLSRAQSSRQFNPVLLSARVNEVQPPKAENKLTSAVIPHVFPFRKAIEPVCGSFTAHLEPNKLFTLDSTFDCNRSKNAA